MASIILKWKKFGTTKTLPRAGRPAKLSNRARMALVREVTKNPMVNVRSVKKQCGLVGLCFGGRMALDLRLSRVRTGVAAMRQDSNYYQLDTTKLGIKRG